MNILDIFKKVGHVLGNILRFANTNGLTDEIIDEALGYVEHAKLAFATPDERRAYVVAVLRSKGLSESVARLAVELAVQEMKRLETL